jgi:hypothetical protein
MQQLKNEQFWLGDGVRISCSAVTSDEVQIEIRRGDDAGKGPSPESPSSSTRSAKMMRPKHKRTDC